MDLSLEQPGHALGDARRAVLEEVLGAVLGAELGELLGDELGEAPGDELGIALGLVLGWTLGEERSMCTWRGTRRCAGRRARYHAWRNTGCGAMGEGLGDTLVVVELGAVLAMHGAVHSKQLTWSVLG